MMPISYIYVCVCMDVILCIAILLFFLMLFKPVQLNTRAWDLIFGAFVSNEGYISKGCTALALDVEVVRYDEAWAAAARAHCEGVGVVHEDHEDVALAGPGVLLCLGAQRPEEALAAAERYVVFHVVKGVW